MPDGESERVWHARQLKVMQGAELKKFIRLCKAQNIAALHGCSLLQCVLL